MSLPAKALLHTECVQGGGGWVGGEVKLNNLALGGKLVDYIAI